MSIGSFFEAIGDGIAGAAKGLWSAGERLVGGIADIAVGAWDIGAGLLTGNLDKAWGGVKHAGGGLIKGVSSLGVVGDVAEGALRGVGVQNEGILNFTNIAGSLFSPVSAISGVANAGKLGNLGNKGAKGVDNVSKISGGAGGVSNVGRASGGSSGLGKMGAGAKGGGAGGGVSNIGAAGKGASGGGSIFNNKGVQGVAAASKIQKPTPAASKGSSGERLIDRASDAADVVGALSGGGVKPYSSPQNSSLSLMGKGRTSPALGMGMGGKTESKGSVKTLQRDAYAHHGFSDNHARQDKIEAPVFAKRPVRVNIQRPSNL